MNPGTNPGAAGDGAFGAGDPRGGANFSGMRFSGISFGGFGNLRDFGMLGQRAQRFLRHSWKLILGLGITSLIAGLLLLLWPGQTTLVVAMLFGIYLIVAGLGQIGVGFALNFSTTAKVLTIAAGALSLIAGILCVINGDMAISLLGAFLGVIWLMFGIARLATLPRPGFTGRTTALISGIASLIGGLVLLVSPIGSVLVLAMVTGAFMIAFGVLAIVQANALRKSLQRF